MTQTEKIKQEIVKREESGISKPKTLENLIKESAKQLGHALPSHMRPERIIRIAMTTLKLNPRLYECDQMSFLGALFQAAQLGLEPNVNGEAWIIPYKVKGVMRAQFQVGAYGWVKMFWNHQSSVSLQMEVVRKNDLFEYNLADGSIKHTPPSLELDRGEAIGYYACACIKGGGRSAKVMSKREVIEHAKRFSKCWIPQENKFMSYTPWQDNFDSMALVTVLKQLMKLLPKSVEIQSAFAMDGTVKSNIGIDMTSIPTDLKPEDYIDAEPTTASAIAAPASVANDVEFG